MLCFGVADPRTVVIIEVVLKYKRWIFLRNRRGQLVDFYEINSDSYACFDSPRLSYPDLRAQIRLWIPGMSPSLCTHLSQRIFVYAQQVASANAGHRLNENGGASKVTVFAEIMEPELQPTDNEQVQEYAGISGSSISTKAVILFAPPLSLRRWRALAATATCCAYTKIRLESWVDKEGDSPGSHIPIWALNSQYDNSGKLKQALKSEFMS
nr:probable E3 ubiquitin-protein ligase RHY1A [Ipomoea batatas]